MNMDDRPSKDKQLEEAGPSSSADGDQHLAAPFHTMEPSTLLQFQGSVENSIVGAGIVHQHNYNLTNINYSGNEAHVSDQHDNSEDMSSFSEGLKLNLQKRAKEISGNMTLPIELDLAINYEKLELKSGVQRSFPELDDEGHYHRRKDFEERFMRPCEGDISFETMFEQALQFAIDEAEKKTKTEEAHAKHVSRHGNIVTVIGQAGIGKTTLARKMVELILKKKLLPNNEYIFFIPFREVDFSTECSLFDFIMTGCDLELSSNSDQLSNSWVKELQENPNVIFIFDGLDEANTDQLSKRNYRITRQTICKPDAFVRKIFCGELFPLAKKLVTSRPRQFFELDPSCRPHFAVDVLGLNKISQDKLGKQICKNNFKKVDEFLLDHPDVSSSLYVPVKCITVFAILSMAADKDSKTTVRSLTDIFVQALDHFLRSEHIREEANEFWKFAKLAWKGFLDRKIIFSQTDIDNVNIRSNAFQAFLVTATERNICFSILEGDKRSSFTHLIWQELFAAINAMFLLPVDEFQSHLDKLTSPLWEVVSKFMFGLCNPAVRKKVSAILPAGMVKDWDVRKKRLEDLVVQSLKQVSKTKSSDKETTPLFLQLCSWLLEMSDPRLDEVVAEHFPSEINLQGSILPTDVSSLTYVMKRVDKPISLTAASYRAKFVQDSFPRLLKGLTKVPNIIQMLDLSENVIDDATDTLLVSVVANTKSLNLPYCQLTNRTVTAIFDKILLQPQPMEKLNLSGNAIDYNSAALLANAIAKIEGLVLWSCDLSSRAISMLSKKISTRSQPMEMLDLGGNAIDDNAAAALAEAVAKVKRLYAWNCQLSRRSKDNLSKKCAFYDCKFYG